MSREKSPALTPHPPHFFCRRCGPFARSLSRAEVINDEALELEARELMDMEGVGGAAVVTHEREVR